MRASALSAALFAAGALFVVLAISTALAWQEPDRTQGANPDEAVIFQARGCAGCHVFAGASSNLSVGPVLTDLARRAGTRVPGLNAVEYVTQSIRSPSAFIVPGYPELMPTIELTDKEVALLVEHLLGSTDS